MPKHTVHYWLINRPEAEADAAYDAGLVDGVWTFKGGMMFVEFTREGDSMEAVAKEVAEDLRKHGVPFDERTLNLRDPTGFLEEHPGWYEDDELAEKVEALQKRIAAGTANAEHLRRHAVLKRNLDNGNK